MKTQNLAVLVTDIAGFTNATARQTREQNAQWLATHAAILMPAFAAFGGTVRKEMGDAFLVTFPSPTDAVLCGTVILDRLWQHNREAAPLMRLNVRVVVNMGEVRVDKTGVFGEPVNVAARVEEVAEGGHLTITEAVFLTMNRSEVETDPLGPHTLAGTGEPVTLYRVRQQAPAPSPEELAPSYPYGALHLHRLTNPAPPPRAAEVSARLKVRGALDGVQRVGDAVTDRRLWKKLGVGAVLALGVGLAGVGGWRAFQEYRQDPFRVIEDRLRAGDVTGAEKLWDQADARGVKPKWRLDYLLGRISLAQGDCEDMLDGYRDALKANETLGDDEALNRDVVACLDRRPSRVSDFIRARLGKQSVPALAAFAQNRAVSAEARLTALDLLEEMGSQDDAEPRAVLLDILGSEQPCSQRREALLRLTARKERKALEPLRALMDSSAPGAPLARQNACLLGALREAVRTLE